MTAISEEALESIGQLTLVKPSKQPCGPDKKPLDVVERLGVISKADVPTDWCTGMVVVPKKNGNVRICIDVKPLNESIL